MIESHTLDPNIAGRIVDLILGKGLDAWVYTPDAWLIRNPNAPHVARETTTVRFDAKVVPNFTCAHLAHAVKIVGVCDDRDRVAVCEMKVQAEFGERASVTRSQPYYLDVTDRQANKGMVVATLAKNLNIPAAEIAALGDTSNDVLMFRESGFSIAMGNANAEVKSQASAVTDTNENDGFAQAMEKFILGRIETNEKDESR
jgi:hypothetical protein